MSSIEATAIIAAMTSVPLLSVEEEQALFFQLRAYDDLASLYADTEASPLDTETFDALEAELDVVAKQRAEIVNHLFCANVRLVLEYASRSHRMEFEDQFQHGAMGLLRAIDRFDHTRTDPATGHFIRFATYATYWIVQFIQRGCDTDESLIRIPVHIREVMKRMKRTEQTLLQTQGHAPPRSVLYANAGGGNLDVGHIMVVSDIPISMHTPFGKFEDKGTLADTLPARDLPLDDFLIEQERVDLLKSQVAEALAALESWRETPNAEPRYLRHAQVLRLRFRIGEDTMTSDEPFRTLEQVGQLMGGITRERTRQLQRTAVTWIRDRYPHLKELLPS